MATSLNSIFNEFPAPWRQIVTAKGLVLLVASNDKVVDLFAITALAVHISERYSENKNAQSNPDTDRPNV